MPPNNIITRRNLIIGGGVIFAQNAYAQNNFVQLNSVKLIKSAREQTKSWTIYDPNYTKIPYPMGDVDRKFGVCTDVIIRAYRAIGIDLQQLVHEDMKKNFNQYPKIWGLKVSDSNIDHRRVPNLKVFFKKFGTQLPVSDNPNDYKAGDIVTCMIAKKFPHIMLISDKSAWLNNQRPLVIHNRGQSVQENDELFAFEIDGHFRYRV
jgi:uncharacterized protein